MFKSDKLTDQFLGKILDKKIPIDGNFSKKFWSVITEKSGIIRPIPNVSNNIPINIKTNKIESDVFCFELSKEITFLIIVINWVMYVDF